MDEHETAKERLLNHAGLPAAKDEKDLRSKSLSYELYVADREQTRPNLGLLDDVVDCPAALNTYFNGPDPDTRPSPRQQPIPDDVTYAVACIITELLQYYRRWSAGQRYSDEVLATLLTGIHKISFCRMQLLASDITRLEEGFE